jgi:hypothetical protein
MASTSSASVASLISLLTPDPWREEVGFSRDVVEAHNQLFASSRAESDLSMVMNNWTSRFQPCLFGRLAARLKMIHYCFLTPHDLTLPDVAIRAKIQESRRAWKREADHGRSSAFILLALSPQIASALPNEAVLDLARRLCFLYLLSAVETDTILLETVALRIPGPEQSVIQWDAGVNYFSSQADRRWWNDHRIPGGLAFSVNSVGHLVKAAQLYNKMADLRQALYLPDDRKRSANLASLGRALELAMLTIAGASSTNSGRATELIPRSDASELTCPIALPPDLADKDCCTYKGYYHTDYTLPSEYFVPDVRRRSDQRTFLLDFTYLFDDSIDNPAFTTMGSGLQVRSERVPNLGTSLAKDPLDAPRKRRRLEGRPVSRDHSS